MSLCIFLWMMSTVFGLSETGSAILSTSNLIPCKQGWFLYDHKCYKVLGETKGLNWKQASMNCSLERGTLATINSAELQKFLEMFPLQRTQSNAWIGLNDRGKESEFTWDDHSPVTYTNWDENQPTGSGESREQEDCVEMQFQNWKTAIGTWNDLSCDKEQPYICQTNESGPSPLLAIQKTALTLHSVVHSERVIQKSC